MGSAILHADPSGILFGARESRPAVFIPPSPGTAVSSRLYPVAPVYSSPFPSPLFTQICPPSDVSMCRSLRWVCVLHPLLNYSYSTCNFNGRDRGGPSHCHVSDITPQKKIRIYWYKYLYLKKSSINFWTINRTNIISVEDQNCSHGIIYSCI